MKHLKLYIILLALSCLALQCDKDKDEPEPDQNNKEQLPPATQSGENTFGCLVNGEVWRPAGGNSLDNDLEAGYGRGSLVIAAERKITDKNGNFQDQDISIYIQKNAYKLKKHKLTINKNRGKWAKFQDDTDTCKYSGRKFYTKYTTDSIHNGFVKLTRVDSIKNIIAGQFEFMAVNDTCGKVDTIKVTKGRFDIKYAY